MIKTQRAASIPKLHHFLSKMHTSRFTDVDGRLYFFNKKSDQMVFGTPNNFFGETHLYTAEDADGHKNTALESEFATLEGRTSVIIEKIVSAARIDMIPALSVEEKGDWDLFFYMQWKRVPDVHRKGGEAYLDDAFAKVRARHPERIVEFDVLDTTKDRKRLLQSGRVKAIAAIGRDVLSVLGDRGLAVIRINAPGESFAIGSLPFVRIGGDLCDLSTEMWLPIASDVAVGVGQARRQEDLFLVNDPRIILGFNCATAAQSSSFAAASKPLIESLAVYVATLSRNRAPAGS